MMQVEVPASRTMQALLPIICEFAKRIDLYKPTGTVYLRFDLAQGGITSKRIGGESVFHKDGVKDSISVLCEDMKRL